jgi:hypothetical protein
LTNTASANPSTTTASGATATYSASAQNVTLTATVTSTAGTVSTGSVTFAVTGIGSVSGGVSNGQASASLPIPAGTAASTYAITATYSGTGYATSSGTNSLTIGKATPALTWATPAPIIYGSALGAGQLNATASVPGSFVYTPAAGIVPPVGNGQTLRVDFTPADAANYTTASKTVTIDVQQATPPPGGKVNLIVTDTLTRDSATQEIVAHLTIANTGGATASNAQLTLLRIGFTNATGLPLTLGSIAAGAQVKLDVRVPAAAGASGARSVLWVEGSYTGGRFQSQMRAILP